MDLSRTNALEPGLVHSALRATREARSKPPRATDTNFGYLLLGLGGGTSDETGQSLRRAMDAAEKSSGIRFWDKPILRQRQVVHQHRVWFSLPDDGRDDREAERIAEALLMATEVAYGPAFDLNNARFSFPVRLSKLRSRSGVQLDALITEIESLIDAAAIFTNSLVGTCMFVDAHAFEFALGHFPVLLRNERLRFAAAFLCTAQHTFYVYPGQMREALGDGERVPFLASELAVWESAFQNCYKCVEAVIGDPPKDHDRYLAKLRSAGLDPDEEVGYRHKARIAQVIRGMNELRDKRAAHGSTMRGIKLHEMLEFQACAAYVLHVAIERGRVALTTCH